MTLDKLIKELQRLRLKLQTDRVKGAGNFEVKVGDWCVAAEGCGGIGDDLGEVKGVKWYPARELTGDELEGEVTDSELGKVVWIGVDRMTGGGT